MKHIVYITHYTGNKLPPWYIGSSYEEKINKGYNGSVASKKYKEIYLKEQKENKHLFKTRILSYHDTHTEALEEELRLQKMHKVVPNDNYFNESYAQINGSHGRDVKGELNPMYGKTHSNEVCNNQKIRATGMVCVRSLSSGEVSYVSLKTWKNSIDLEAESKGRKIKNTEKYAHNGSRNNAALKIDIFNSDGVVIHSTHGNFSDVCEKNNLPCSSLANTYRNETFISYGKYNIKGAKKKGYDKFIGWYARKV